MVKKSTARVPDNWILPRGVNIPHRCAYKQAQRAGRWECEPKSRAVARELIDPRSQENKKSTTRVLFLFWWKQLDLQGVRKGGTQAHARSLCLPQLAAFALQNAQSSPRSVSFLQGEALWCRSVVLVCAPKKIKRAPRGCSFYFGGNNWTRTSDPLHVKQVL